MTAIPFDLPAPAGFVERPVWTGREFKVGTVATPVLEYSENFEGWSDDLTTLHEQAVGQAHPIDLASRADALRQLSLHVVDTRSTVIMEIGCSSGFLLGDIARRFKHATVLGADVVRLPLELLAQRLPGVPLFRFDLLQCPFPAEILDAAVALNVLEHIEDDVAALTQLFRLLKPGAVAVLEVPAGPELYDSYDKALMHFRRYALTDLLGKLQKVGFSIERRSHLGVFVYPAFAFVKRRNQRAAGHDVGVVARQARQTGSSGLMHLAMSAESWLGRFVSYPVGIRCLVTARKP